jgi:hypothetical protein
MLRPVALVRIPEDTILHSHHRENLKSYISVLDFVYHVTKQINFTSTAKSSHPQRHDNEAKLALFLSHFLLVKQS